MESGYSVVQAVQVNDCDGVTATGSRWSLSMSSGTTGADVFLTTKSSILRLATAPCSIVFCKEHGETLRAQMRK